MLILVVGQYSCVGKIRALLANDEETMTPLQVKLESLATGIGKFGLYSAITIVVVLILRFSIQRTIKDDWNFSTDIK